MAFRVGQRVECINDSGQRLFDGEYPVIAGQKYTVREICGHGILVEEILNPPSSIFGERFYYGYRFRPLITRKTDISIFTAMLGPREKVTT